MSLFKIYSSLLSANGRKVEAVCQHLSLDVEVIRTNVYKGEGQSEDYLSINPLGKIPALQDNDITLSESNAIIIYIAEKYAANALRGNSFAEQARVNKWLFWESSHWQPALSVMEKQVAHKLLPEHFPVPDAPTDWTQAEIQRQLIYLERNLSDANYLVGDELSIADFSVAAMTTYFRATHFPFHQYPNINRWYNTLSDLPAWVSTEHELWCD